MSEVEAVLWGLADRHPELRPVVTVVGVFDRPPDQGRLRSRLEVVSRHLPRLRQRVRPAGFDWAPPQWEIDPDFDLDYHLKVVTCPGAGVLEDLLGVAGHLSVDGLDRDRPLWQVTTVGGLTDGRGGLVLKLHHSLTDGLGLLELAGLLFDLDRHAPVEPPGLPPVPIQPDAPTSDLGRDLAGEMARTVDLARWAVPALARGVAGAIGDPGRAAEDLAAMLASGYRLMEPTTTPMSPILTERSVGMRFGEASFDLAAVVAAGRRGGGTVNDAFVAGVAEGLRRYHVRHRSKPPALRLGMAVSRRGQDRSLANRFAPTRVAVPLQIRDPTPRVAALHHLLLAARREPALDLVEGAAGVAARLPFSQRLMATVLGSVDVMTSNVAGSPAPLYLSGARMLRLVPFGPRSGAALNVTVVSYDGCLEVGMHADPAAAPDADVLFSCLRTGLAATIGAP